MLTQYLPLYFPEADRFHRSSRTDWFLAFLEMFPSAVPKARTSHPALPPTRSLQKFAAVHASIHNLFNLERALSTRFSYKARRAAALNEWPGLFQVHDGIKPWEFSATFADDPDGLLARPGNAALAPVRPDR